MRAILMISEKKKLSYKNKGNQYPEYMINTFVLFSMIAEFGMCAYL
jgi:hypothetical protein